MSLVDDIRSLRTRIAETEEDLSASIEILREISKPNKFLPKGKKESEVKAAIKRIEDARDLVNGWSGRNPDDVWFETEEGRLVSKASLWLYGDKLVSFAVAARILRGEESDRIARQQYINNLVYPKRVSRKTRPLLKLYWDVTVDDHPKRVHVDDLEKMRKYIRRESRSGKQSKGNIKIELSAAPAL